MIQPNRSLKPKIGRLSFSIDHKITHDDLGPTLSFSTSFMPAPLRTNSLDTGVDGWPVVVGDCNNAPLPTAHCFD